MDNQTIDVTSEGEAGVAHALAIIWKAAATGGKAVHYKIVKLRERTKYFASRADKLPENVEGIKGYHVNHFTDWVNNENDENGLETLILLWHEEYGSVRLPFPLDESQAAAFIWNWLTQAKLGNEPDHDGSNEPGWRLFTQDWGHVAGHSYAIVAAQPAWAMYGK